MKRLMLVVFVLLVNLTFAKTYYVDAVAGNDANSGTSTTSAWKSISKVNAITFAPGDFILFKRGQTWRGTITVRNSGTSGYPITYGAYGTGTRPVIDLYNSLGNGIVIKSKSYIVVDGFKITNAGKISGSGGVYISYGNYITVRNNEMYVSGRSGVFVQESKYCVITNNRMTTPSGSYPFQTDGIYGQRNSGNTYSKNHIVISNGDLDEHCDGIQLYQENNGKLIGNYVEQNNTKPSTAQGLYVENPTGTFEIYNNIAYGMYTGSSMIKFKNYGIGTGRVKMIGNTLYGGKSQLVQTDDPNIVFKNNIIYTTGSTNPVAFEKTITTPSNVNNNIYRRSGSGGYVVRYSSGYKTFSQWKAMGFDRNSYEIDPMFNSPSVRDFRVKTGSYAINRGQAVGAPFNVDYVNAARPMGAAYDMGAYERDVLAKANDESDSLTAYMMDTTDWFVDSTDLGTLASNEQNKTGENQNLSAPEKFELAQNFPNPFNPSTTIKFALPKNMSVVLKIYDMTGAEVATLINEVRAAGNYQLNFDGSNLASGTYIYRIITPEFTQSKKMLLIK